MSKFGFSQRKHNVSVKKTDLLMFYREMIDIDCENYKKDMTHEEMQVFNTLRTDDADLRF